MTILPTLTVEPESWSEDCDDCFEYTVAVRASWQSLAGETRTLDFENGGDDLSEEEAWERVLDALIRERAQVEVHAKPGYRPA